MTRIVAVSDLHTYLPEIPDCDLLIVAGDAVSMSYPPLDQERFLTGPFSDWLDAAPAREIVGVSGNHEMVPEAVLAELPWHYLSGRTVELCGLRVHGLPWTNRFADMPYQDDLGRELPNRLPPRFAAVPEGLDVLVSHQPPSGLLDHHADGPHRGSEALRWTLERARPRLCVVGHIHLQGSIVHAGVQVVNAALAGRSDRPVHPPVVLEL